MSAHPEPDDPDIEGAKEWLRFALADLAVARGPLPPESLYNVLCFHAQQAVEKSLKALLAYHHINFPRTHSIGQLIDLLPAHLDMPDQLEDATSLTFYAIALRYPSDYEDVIEETWAQAVQSARVVYNWAKNLIV